MSEKLSSPDIEGESISSAYPQVYMKNKREKHRFSLLWCHLESNQGHTDFQSVALPTELWHLSKVEL